MVNKATTTTAMVLGNKATVLVNNHTAPVKNHTAPVKNHTAPDNKVTITAPINKTPVRDSKVLTTAPGNKATDLVNNHTVPVKNHTAPVNNHTAPDNKVTITAPINKTPVRDSKVLTTAPGNKALDLVKKVTDLVNKATDLINKAAMIIALVKEPVAMVQGLPAVNTAMVNNKNKLQATVAAMTTLKMTAALNTEEQALPMILMDPEILTTRALDLVNKVAADMDLAQVMIMDLAIKVENRVMEIKAVREVDMEGVMTAIIKGCSWKLIEFWSNFILLLKNYKKSK